MTLSFIPAETNTTTPTSEHLFKPGDVCELHSLTTYPDFNGQQVTITSVREDGPNGRAYYFTGKLNQHLNWVYETRLKIFQPA